MHGRQSLAAKTKGCARLCARFNLHANVSVNGRHFHLVAERGLRNGEEEIVDEVVLVADEVGAFRFLNEHLNISGDALEFGSVALAGSIDHHAFSHTGRYVDFNDLLALHDSLAVTL